MLPDSKNFIGKRRPDGINLVEIKNHFLKTLDMSRIVNYPLVDCQLNCRNGLSISLKYTTRRSVALRRAARPIGR